MESANFPLRPPSIKYSGDPMDRANEKLLEIVPIDGKRPYNVIKVIEEIQGFDNPSEAESFELHNLR